MISIPFPVLSGGAHFAVTIKNSSGVTVYGPSPQTNAPFDPGITTTGDYVMTIDNNGADSGYCFTIPPCTTCPAVSSITLDEGTAPLVYGYAHFKFDMMQGFRCPFIISGTISTGGTFSVTVNNLTDFDSNAGSIYDKTIWIGGDTTSISYSIDLVSGTHCASGNIAPACVGSTFSALSLTPDTLSGQYILSFQYDTCGSPCHNMSWNYLQVAPAHVGFVPDAGSFTDTVTCSGLPHVRNFYLSPTGVEFNDTLTYNFSATDCCGVVRTFSLSYTPPCVGPTMNAASGVGIGMDGGGNIIIFMLDKTSNGTDCSTFIVTYSQTNTGYTSGLADSGTHTVVASGASGAFTLAIIHPNLTFPSYGGNINHCHYAVNIQDCCGNIVFSGGF